MKKIKFLHGFLVTLLTLFTISFFAQIYNVRVLDLEFEYSEIIIGMIIFFMIIIGLFFLQRALFSIIKNGFFNNKAYSSFKKAGLFFLIAGFGGALFDIVMILRMADNIFELLYSNLGMDFLLIMIGFSLFIIADVVKNGNILKQENDLTI